MGDDKSLRRSGEMAEALISYLALVVIVSCRALWSTHDEDHNVEHRPPTLFGMGVAQ
jgi:hypothetical protein